MQPTPFDEYQLAKVEREPAPKPSALEVQFRGANDAALDLLRVFDALTITILATADDDPANAAETLTRIRREAGTYRNSMLGGRRP